MQTIREAKKAFSVYALGIVILSCFSYTSLLVLEEFFGIDYLKNIKFYPTLFYLVEGELAHAGAVELGEKVNVSFKTVPETPRAGEKTKFEWRVTNLDGENIELNPVMHFQAMHVYLIRDDLTSEIIHLHPRESSTTPSLFEDSTTFPTGGKWRLANQFAAEHTLFNTVSMIDVLGEEEKTFERKWGDEVIREDWIVRLERETLIKKGVPTTLRFVFKNENIPESEIKLHEINTNLLFLRREDPFIWNEHGDRSVKRVSRKAGWNGDGPNIDKNTISFEAAFPEAGKWMLSLEYLQKPVEFLVEVVE